MISNSNILYDEFGGETNLTIPISGVVEPNEISEKFNLPYCFLKNNNK